MKKRIVVLLFITLLLQKISAKESSYNSEDSYSSNIGPTLEGKAGYFFFADSTMRKIYDKGGIDLQISGFYPFKVWAKRYGLGVYGSVEYLHRSGKSLGDRQKTSIWEIPVNLGLKPVISIIPSIQYYFAVGPRYFYVHQHNNSSYVNRNNRVSTVGLFANSGFNFFPLPHFVIDIFGEYSYGKASFHSSKPNVYTVTKQIGGYTFGMGLGYNF